MDAKLLRVLIPVALLTGAVYLLLLWQPARQVRLHQANFFRALEKRDAARAAEFMSGSYADRWGHDKDFVVRESRELFQHFIAFKIVHEERYLRPGAGEMTLATKIALTGTGSPIADYAKQRVGALTEPFLFRWKKQSWKPWDWQLVSFDQSQLELQGLP